MLRSYEILKGNRRKFCVFESANCGLGYEFDLFSFVIDTQGKKRYNYYINQNIVG